MNRPCQFGAKWVIASEKRLLSIILEKCTRQQANHSEPWRYVRKLYPLHARGGDRAGEATVLYNMASLLYRYLNQTEGAIVYVEQAITVMQETGLSHDAAGDSLEDLQQTLYFMRTGASL
jgi:hypothetical protein